jgi:hypothetical protein
VTIELQGDTVYVYMTAAFVPTSPASADIVKVIHPDGRVEFLLAADTRGDGA